LAIYTQVDRLGVRRDDVLGRVYVYVYFWAFLP
jgi:hypothetical protein